MFKIKNEITGKIARECCSRQVLTFASAEEAHEFARLMQLNAAVDRKRAKYVVICA